MKCSLCKAPIEETFLEKIRGSYLKDAKGKKYPICAACQATYQNDKDEMLKKL